MIFLEKNIIRIYIYLGRGGASIYGKEFDDEISNELKHTGMYIRVQN
jgi:hypothetical protein